MRSNKSSKLTIIQLPKVIYAATLGTNSVCAEMSSSQSKIQLKENLSIWKGRSTCKSVPRCVKAGNFQYRIGTNKIKSINNSEKKKKIPRSLKKTITRHHNLNFPLERISKRMIHERINSFIKQQNHNTNETDIQDVNTYIF